MQKLDIDDPAQLKALTSSRRQDIVLLLEQLGDASIKEIADELRVQPDSLYYHLRELEKVGLAVRSGRRQGVTKAEQTWRLPASKLHVRYDAGDAESSTLLYESIATVLRESARHVRRSIDEGWIDTDTRDLRTYRANVVLTQRAFGEVCRHLRAIEQIVDAHRHRRQGRRYAITQILCPLEP